MPEQLDLDQVRRCAELGERAAVEGMEHASFAYFRWIRRQAEMLLYADLWVEPEEPPE